MNDTIYQRFVKKMNDTSRSLQSPWIKMAVEFGPLLVYLLLTLKVYERFGIDLDAPAYRPAVMWLVLVTPFQVAFLWLIERKLPWSAMITAVFLIAFGSISLYMGDDRWMKAKPSVVYALLAGAFVVGLLTGRPLLKYFLASQIETTDEKWQRLTINFIIFFLIVMVLNIVVWFGFDAVYGIGSDASFTAWSFSKPVFVVASIIFSIWQMLPLIQSNIHAQNSTKRCEKDFK